MMDADSVDLAGVIDLHVHTAPDVRPRLMDDLEFAQVAAMEGMSAVLLKSHHTITADRASLVNKQVEGVRVFGGLALNTYVGGLNPAAVEAALALGARQIWMPTLTAENHLRRHHEARVGINILDQDRKLLPEVFEILNLIAESGVILGTGHLSVSEIIVLVDAARKAGVRHILITHPELPVVGMELEIQEALSGPGVYFERAGLVTRLKEHSVPLSVIARAVKRLGAEKTVLVTDLGQVFNPSPMQGMREMIAGMLELGISQREIDQMTKENPAHLLNLQ